MTTRIPNFTEFINEAKKPIHQYIGPNGKWILVYDNPNYDKNRAKVRQINAELSQLTSERNELMRDVEQEAETEGGPIADKYGAKLNKIDDKVAKLIAQKSQLDVNPEIEEEGADVPGALLRQHYNRKA